VNGDGLDDLIVGAHQANLSSGKSYVVFGKQDTNTTTIITHCLTIDNKTTLHLL
jgi:hypothetical protein